MNRYATLVAGGAVTAVVALALVLRPSTVEPTTHVATPPATGTLGPSAPRVSLSAAAPVATHSAPPVTRPWPNGTYQADIPVADILELLGKDSTLTARDQQAIIDDILHVRGATTLHVRVVLDDSTFNLLQSVDDEPLQPSIPKPWRIASWDGSTISLIQGTGESGTQRYAVEGFARDYNLRPLTPAASAVETFVRRLLFQAEPFSPVQ